jgi:hypothetical protein
MINDLVDFEIKIHQLLKEAGAGPNLNFWFSPREIVTNKTWTNLEKELSVVSFEFG